MTKAAAIGLAGALALLAFAPAPALAGRTYLSASCPASERYDDETTCSQPNGAQVNVSFTIDALGPPTIYWVRLAAPAEHCAKVKYLLYQQDSSGGFALIDATRFLDRGESETLVIRDMMPRGRQAFEIGAIGEVGGCNGGAMQSWGVWVEPMVVPQ
jgi:hypothetical protein